jgi:hypothetical protein
MSIYIETVGIRVNDAEDASEHLGIALGQL